MSPWRVKRWLASWLPHRALVALSQRWPIDYDPSDGWSMWMDASYERWCRSDRLKARLGLRHYEDEDFFE